LPAVDPNGLLPSPEAIDAGIAGALRTNLEVEGHEVAVAPDGEAGLARWRSWQPTLVILDLMLPKIEGLALLRSWKWSRGASCVAAPRWGCARARSTWSASPARARQ
jgi:Response regulator receiver domain